MAMASPVLNATELWLLTEELRRELLGAAVQKVFAPSVERLVLELRVPGRTVLLHFSAEPQAARVGVLRQRAPNPRNPPGWQSVLRRELTACRLARVYVAEPGTVLVTQWAQPSRNLTLLLDLARPALLLLSQSERVVAQSLLRNRESLLGKPFAVPSPFAREAAPDFRLSRLSGDERFLRLNHASEVRFEQALESSQLVQRTAEFNAQRKRLRATIEKVRQESQRGALAEQYRQEAEALTHNLHAVTRGQSSAVVTHYQADGTINQLTVRLDVTKSPKENVAWRFHQYRRLTKGVEISKARLGQLEAQLAQLETEGPEAPVVEHEPSVGRERTGATKEKASKPFHDYVSASGQHLWVGRGAAHNDALTFKHARPFHYWFHVRGVPGAHVVVPLEKTQTLGQETLLDAAHLAAFHSDAKGEAKVEVSYTQVKYVSKAKGAARGAVKYVQEKTIVLRFEAERLKRLTKM
jgi:predicted ribosome quality control (RQC) complex YloA/Tae2 family protein